MPARGKEAFASRRRSRRLSLCGIIRALERANEERRVQSDAQRKSIKIARGELSIKLPTGGGGERIEINRALDRAGNFNR